MIDIKLLKQSQYTFADIASLFHVEQGKVKSDIRRLKYPTQKKMVAQTKFLGAVRMRRKVAVNCVAKEYVLKYHKYLNVSMR